MGAQGSRSRPSGPVAREAASWKVTPCRGHQKGLQAAWQVLIHRSETGFRLQHKEGASGNGVRSWPWKSVRQMGEGGGLDVATCFTSSFFHLLFPTELPCCWFMGKCWSVKPGPCPREARSLKYSLLWGYVIMCVICLSTTRLKGSHSSGEAIGSHQRLLRRPRGEQGSGSAPPHLILCWGLG